MALIISPGWAVELNGEIIDLDDFREYLKPPFEPWIENYRDEGGQKTKLLLRSRAWQNLTEAGDVMRDATRILERLNGAARLLQTDAQPVRLGPLMKFGPDGRQEPVTITGRMNARLGNVRVRGRAITNSPPSPPRPSKMQVWLNAAEENEVRAELLQHVTRASHTNGVENWFDLYKVMELARRLCGNGKKLRELLQPVERDEWNRIRQTANSYRHSPNNPGSPLPNAPAPWDEAIEFVLKILPRLL
jgi:hypothetical protein